jgi:hypothetical protein
MHMMKKRSSSQTTEHKLLRRRDPRYTNKSGEAKYIQKYFEQIINGNLALFIMMIMMVKLFAKFRIFNVGDIFLLLIES